MFSSLVCIIVSTTLILSARAQFDAGPNCNQLAFDINTDQAADTIRNCATLVGSVHIDLSNASGIFRLNHTRSILGGLVIHSKNLTDEESEAGFQDVELSMPALREVKGRLEASEAANLVALNMPNLTSIENQLHLHDLAKLGSVNMNNLDLVGTLMLDNLPALTTLQIDKGISQVTGFEGDGDSGWHDAAVVVRKTALSKLDHFNFSTVAVFEIIDNWNLESIVMALTETTRAKSRPITVNHISSNGGSKTTLSLPHLWRLDADFTKFHGLARIDVPRLRKIWGSLHVVDNSLLTTLNASRLVEISRELIIAWNPSLSRISFPALRTVNSLATQATKALGQSDGVTFGDLREVKDVHIGGDRSGVDCRLWDNLRCTGIINTVYTCDSDRPHWEQVAIAEDAKECQSTYPVHGWTRARKSLVAFQVILSVMLVVFVLLITLVCYGKEVRGIIAYVQALRHVAESRVEEHSLDMFLPRG